jgi:hypothetical protein
MVVSKNLSVQGMIPDSYLTELKIINKRLYRREIQMLKFLKKIIHKTQKKMLIDPLTLTIQITIRKLTLKEIKISES